MFQLRRKIVTKYKNIKYKILKEINRTLATLKQNTIADTSKNNNCIRL